ncbi:MAG: hypothetical protein D3924_02320 [Candidatus Electrothrix sp. AR4]|nr:hypothetical protein [Candidatus Electrothrix sp. AR4]
MSHFSTENKNKNSIINRISGHLSINNLQHLLWSILLQSQIKDEISISLIKKLLIRIQVSAINFRLSMKLFIFS